MLGNTLKRMLIRYFQVYLCLRVPVDHCIACNIVLQVTYKATPVAGYRPYIDDGVRTAWVHCRICTLNKRSFNANLICRWITIFLWRIPSNNSKRQHFKDNLCAHQKKLCNFCQINCRRRRSKFKTFAVCHVSISPPSNCELSSLAMRHR